MEQIEYTGRIAAVQSDFCWDERTMLAACGPKHFRVQ
jgi:hypothetical protein